VAGATVVAHQAPTLPAPETEAPLGNKRTQRSGRRRLVRGAQSGRQVVCPPLVGFVDERIEDHAHTKRVIVGFCIFNRARWTVLHQEEQAVRRLRGRRRLDFIESLLDRVGGRGSVGYADIPKQLLTGREIDGTEDIPRMSRGDNVWGLVVLTSIFGCTSRLQAAGVPLGHMNVYYDRKDLTREHRGGIENVLRTVLPGVARDAAAEHPAFFTGNVSSLQIESIEQVPKAPRGETLNPLQSGVRFVDQLCRQLDGLVLRDPSDRLLAVDLTSAVMSALSQFLKNDVASSE